MKKYHKIFFVVLAFCIVFNNLFGQAMTELRNLGFVVVSPDGPLDGGDFGSNTPGTQTAGIQEALNFAKDNLKEVYIVGGGINAPFDDPVVYNVNTTITMPWGQDWQVTGGEYTLNFTQSSGDCLVIDSAMNCIFEFGNIQAPNLTSGNIVKVRPATVGPDNFVVIVASRFKFNAIRGSGTVDVGGDVSGSGTGLLLDGSAATIADSFFMVNEVSHCATGIHVDVGGVRGNSLTCKTIFACNTYFRDDVGSFNTYDLRLNTEGLNLSNLLGARLTGGRDNIYTLGVNGGFDPGDALIFEGSTDHNLIYTMGVSHNGISVNTSTTNRVVSAQAIGFDISTPAVPGSSTTTGGIRNDTGYSVIITILTSGTVNEWRLVDGNGNSNTVSSGLTAGQSIYLEPGDTIRISYSAAPTWRWRAIR